MGDTELAAATTVFAELTGFRQPRVFRIDRFPDDLIGYQGAAAFDFYHSRYRRILQRALEKGRYVQTDVSAARREVTPKLLPPNTAVCA